VEEDGGVLAVHENSALSNERYLRVRIHSLLLYLFTSIQLKMKTEIEIDVEDEAAKISVEEEMQLTNVRTLQNDIDSGHHFSISRRFVPFPSIA